MHKKLHLNRGDRHECFQLAVQAFLHWTPGQPEPVIVHDSDKLTLKQACGAVWNCTDIFPGGQVLPEDLGFRTSTYAAVARALHAQLT